MLRKNKEKAVKVKVPGAASSTGIKAQDFSLPKGDYVFEIGEVSIKESDNTPCIIHTFPMVVLDGPDDEKTGRSTQGRKWTRRIIQLLPEHGSYSPANTRAADEIADLCAATDVELDSDDSYETEDFAGTKVKAKLGIRIGKDAAGDPQPENSVLQQRAEDGTNHMWLPDDGAAVKKAPSSAKKATTAKKSPSAKSKR
jgi:hypothetical protein